MPVGYLQLFPGGLAPDSSGSGNNAAALSYEVSGAAQGTNSPKAAQMKLLFDAATDEHWLFQFQIPGDYGSGGTLRGRFKMASATSGNIQMKGGQVTSVDSSTDDDALAFGTADLSSVVVVPGTQGQVKEFTIALTDANRAANRKSLIFVGRNADAGGTDDDATGDLELLALAFEYTTT